MAAGPPRRPPFTSGTLNPRLDYQLRRAIADLGRAVNQQQTTFDDVVGQIGAMAPSYTLQQISQALTSHGPTPLNVTGLTGQSIYQMGLGPGGIAPDGPPGPLMCLTDIGGGQPGGIPPKGDKRWFRGDFIGMNVPGLSPVPGGSPDPALVISFLLDQYPAGEQTTILSEYANRGYTHFVLSWPDSRSASLRGGVDQSIAQFVATAQLVLAAGFYPVIFLSSKDFDPADVGVILGGIAPVLAALNAVGCAGIICAGWELSLWLNPTQVQQLIDGIAGMGYTEASGHNLYVHFQQGYIAFQQPGNFTAAFWVANVNKLTGLLFQKEYSDDCGLYQAHLNDGLARFAGGFGFPADSGFGHPFDDVAYEYAATDRFFGAFTEGQAQTQGTQSISALGPIPVMGFCNGGPNV